MDEKLTRITTDIISSFVAHNSIRPDDLVALIGDVHGRLVRISTGEPQVEEAVELTPLMPIKKTVTKDYIISLEDGKKYRTMRRHLATLGLTPDQYKVKWGLPKDYPMVCSAYSERRSELAKAAGLGRHISRPEIKARIEAESKGDTVADEVPATATPKRARAHPKAEQTRKTSKKAAELAADAA